MLRLAVIRPSNTAVPLYEKAIARGCVCRVAIVVGEERIGDGSILAGEDQLDRHFDHFDACVVHANVDVSHMERWIGARKHILLDSPTYDLAQLDHLADKGRDVGVHLMIAQPHRFTPYATAIRNDLEAGHLGQPGLVRIHRWEPIASAESSLRSLLWQMLVQELDLACWFYGMPPQRIFGQTIPTENEAVGMLGHIGFDSGMAVLDCTFHAGGSYYMVTAIGSQGAAYADDHRNANLLLKDRAEALFVKNEDNWWRRQLEFLSQSIKSETTDQTVDETKRAMLACQALIESAATNRVATRIGDRYELQ